MGRKSDSSLETKLQAVHPIYQEKDLIHQLQSNTETVVLMTHDEDLMNFREPLIWIHQEP